jgi:O-antigen/teichoic acid export membrane protein
VTRTGRLARALLLGYGYQAIVLVVGVVLTPILLGQLGAQAFGQWLVVGQVLGWLALLDLGVVMLLPREVALAAGDPNRVGGPAEVVRRARWMVTVQLPLVALVAAGAWAGVAAFRPELAGPLAVVLGGFVLTFPLRLYPAILSGLQDVDASTGVTALGWAVSTALSVALVFAGWGLYALMVGWVVGQSVTGLAAWLRVRAKFPQARGAGGWTGWPTIWAQLRLGVWGSTGKLAQMLSTGTDLIIVAWLLGPPAVVVYSCTGKIIQVLLHQVAAIPNGSVVPLAELRGTGQTDRLWRAIRAVLLVTLLVSGGSAVAAAAVNPTFVVAWVGAEQYAGPLTSALLALCMVARHLGSLLFAVVYVFGNERRTAAIAAAEGIVTAGAMAGWVTAFGVVGVPLGILTGLLLVTIPAGVTWWAAQAGVSRRVVVGWVVPWLVRFAVVFAAVAAATFAIAPADRAAGAALTAAAAAAYALAVYPLAAGDLLADYRNRLLSAVRARFRRTPGPTNPA